ncbi:MAG: Gp15 family bacteriophage protein [Enterocloster sp.]
MIRLGQLPVTLKVGKKEWKIRTDYRDILVIMQVFNDPELTVEELTWLCVRSCMKAGQICQRNFMKRQLKRRSGSWTVARKRKRI